MIEIATNGTIVTIASLFQLSLIIILYVCYFLNKRKREKIPKGDLYEKNHKALHKE
jgi:hypothetical protein